MPVGAIATGSGLPLAREVHVYAAWWFGKFSRDGAYVRYQASPNMAGPWRDLVSSSTILLLYTHSLTKAVSRRIPQETSGLRITHVSEFCGERDSGLLAHEHDLLILVPPNACPARVSVKLLSAGCSKIYDSQEALDGKWTYGTIGCADSGSGAVSSGFHTLSDTLVRLTVSDAQWATVWMYTLMCVGEHVLQVVVGLPLLLPVPEIHGPTISLYQALSKGPGGYVGGTILVTVAVLLGSSIWEAIALDARENESSHQCASSGNAKHCNCHYGSSQHFQQFMA